MIIRETGCVEEFGDIRQALGMFLTRAELTDGAKQHIDNAQNALDALGLYLDEVEETQYRKALGKL